MTKSESTCFFGVPSKDGIYQISYEITNRCNLHCIHCMNKSDNCDTTVTGLPWKDMEILLEEMAANNVKELYISGGEPTMYTFFNQLVKKSKFLGMDTLLATNAYDIEAYLDSIKKYVDIVFVSIDGTPEKHDFFRGQEGAYRRTIRSIKKLLDEKIPVRISTVVSKNNLNDLEKIIKELCDLGVFQVHFTVLVNVGRAANGDMLIDSEEYKKITNTIEKLQTKYEKEGFKITTRRNGKLCEDTGICYAGRRMAHLNALGVLSPCSYVAKCPLADRYSIQWKPGEFSKCLEHVKEFQSLCEQRTEHFGHPSCAALASITTGTDDIYALDPLDVVW